MSSSCSNPFLYGWLNQNFRNEFKEIFNMFKGYVRTVCLFIIPHSLTTRGSLAGKMVHRKLHDDHNDQHGTSAMSTTRTNKHRYSKHNGTATDIIQFRTRNSECTINSDYRSILNLNEPTTLAMDALIEEERQRFISSHSKSSDPECTQVENQQGVHNDHPATPLDARGIEDDACPPSVPPTEPQPCSLHTLATMRTDFAQTPCLSSPPPVPSSSILPRAVHVNGGSGTISSMSSVDGRGSTGSNHSHSHPYEQPSSHFKNKTAVKNGKFKRFSLTDSRRRRKKPTMQDNATATAKTTSTQMVQRHDASSSPVEHRANSSPCSSSWSSHLSANDIRQNKPTIQVEL